MNIILDAGGVLFYIDAWRNTIYKRILKSEGYEVDKIDKAIEGLKAFDRTYFETDVIRTWEDEKAWLTSRAYFLAMAVDPCHPVLADKLFMLAFDSFQYKIYEETYEVLDALKQAGHQLYVLSNATASLDWAFDYLALRPYFEAVFISAYIGLEKPNPMIFREALNLIQDQAQNCLFVDDKLNHVEVAEKCGIKAMHLDRSAGMTLHDFKAFVDKMSLIKV